MPAACSTGAYPQHRVSIPKGFDFMIGPVLRRRKVGEAEAKPVGQTFRAPEELAGCGEVPSFGLFCTSLPVYAEAGERGKAQPDKRLVSEMYKVGVGAVC